MCLLALTAPRADWVESCSYVVSAGALPLAISFLLLSALHRIFYVSFKWYLLLTRFVKYRLNFYCGVDIV